jgi:L-ribulokinase
MASLSETRFQPRPENRAPYDALYAEYLRLHDLFGRGGDEVMRRLRRLRG